MAFSEVRSVVQIHANKLHLTSCKPKRFTSTVQSLEVRTCYVVSGCCFLIHFCKSLLPKKKKKRHLKILPLVILLLLQKHQGLQWSDKVTSSKTAAMSRKIQSTGIWERTLIMSSKDQKYGPSHPTAAKRKDHQPWRIATWRKEATLNIHSYQQYLLFGTTEKGRGLKIIFSWDTNRSKNTEQPGNWAVLSLPHSIMGCRLWWARRTSLRAKALCQKENQNVCLFHLLLSLPTMMNYLTHLFNS